ncbi:serine/threonine-protein kinase PknK [Myxococcus sp. RHSTA-1-4]|uniref:serine/threonine-protein kinase n=1 Tax=Myxococcus sp. RHSTA-1-4 TaxID=2874601 RepID=UPI001CBFFE2C|nr:serine/threonine-protein kinase [Myxococcus sp. RHSTA-1-4]
MARGGFGLLLAARREVDGAPVAIKVAHPEHPMAGAQLSHEGQVLRAIGPPTVPAVYEVGRLPGDRPYLVMQRLESPTLAGLLERCAGPLPRGVFAPCALALVDAVAAVHARGFLHGDLKPEHVYVDSSAGRATLIDFGLARPLAPPGEVPPFLCTGGAFAGTAEYMAPEQCAGAPALDARADLYALGVLFYEMLTGRTPFFGAQADVFQAHLSLRPPRLVELTSVPEALEAVVLRCLAKEPERRFDSAVAVRLALQEALAREERPSAITRAPEAPARPAVPNLSRRTVAVLFFHSGATAVTLQKLMADFGGHLAFYEGTRFAAVFDPNTGENPAQRARRAAEGLAAHELAPAVLLDVTSVTVQQSPGAPARYFGGVLTRKDRYPEDGDPATLLLTAAAMEALPELPCLAVPGRPGLFRRASRATPQQDLTTILPGAEPSGLVGREGELAELMGSARAALEERAPTLASVVGEWGSGKSFLGACLAQRMREALPGVQVYAWRARQPAPGAPEGTLRALMSGALGAFHGEGTGPKEEGRASLFHLLGAELGEELWPVVAATLGWLSPDADELRERAVAPGALHSLALRAAGELLAARARRQPLCLIIDDAHEAGEAALDALEYATLAESHLPLWVCVLARPGFQRLRPEWGARAARSHLLTLGPLPRDGAVELCRNLLEPAENVPIEVLERLAERAQRVPRLLVELVHGLKRQGRVRQRPGGGSWYLTTDQLDEVPELHLVEWLAERELRALPATLAAHARLCALLGTGFTTAELEGVVRELEQDGGAADFPLDPLYATRRLRELGLLVAQRQGGHGFRDELLRATVARELPEAERVRIHRAAYRYFQGQPLATDRQRLPKLARHAAAAGLSEDAAALYIQLAESARGRHAYLEAESTYTRALELLPEDDARRRLAALRGRGLMRYRVGRYEDSQADFAEARALARFLCAAGDEVELLLDEAMALDWTNDYASSEARVGEAQRLARERGLQSPQLQVRLLLGWGRARLRAGQWAEACVPLEEAATRALALGDAGYESWVVSLLLLAAILPMLGRIDDADRIFDELIAACYRRGDRLHLGSALNNRRNLRVARGDLPGALRDQEQFMRLGRELGMVGWEYFAEYNMGELLYQAGDTEAALPHITRAISLEQRHREVAPRPWALLLHARVLARMGEDARAREQLAEVRRSVSSTGTPLSPSEDVLLSLVELATRESSPEEWRALQTRADACSVEQEPLEVLELQAVARLRRGEREAPVGLLEEALRRAAGTPNLMQARLRRGLEWARGRAAG